MGNTCQHPRTGALVAALALLPSWAAADEADVFNATAAYSSLMDNNVFRLSPSADTRALVGSAARNDIIDTTRASVSLDKTFGRQRLSVDSSLSHNRYRRFSYFDNDGSSLNGNFAWELSDLLSGTFSSGHTKSMSGFGNGLVQAPVRNMNVADTSAAALNVRFDPRWRLVLGAQHISSHNDSPLGTFSNTRIDVSSASLRYSGGEGTEFGLSSSLSKARYPNLQSVGVLTVDNSYDESSLSADWALQWTGASRFSGSLGETRRTMRQLSQRDFSGLTGNLAWDWQVSGKTTLNLARGRNLAAAGDLNASYVVNDLASLSATWAATGKLRLVLQAAERRSNYRGDPTAIASALPKREDVVDSVGLTLRYEAQRNLNFSLAANVERRNSNYDGSFTTDFRYRDRTVNLSMDYSF